jgi:hypothetical protein
VDPLRRWATFVRDRYAVMDPRTAGLFRAVLGLLCAADLVRRWAYVRTFYSNEGLLPSPDLLEHPPAAHAFSLFHAFASPGEVHLAFALALFCHLCLMVGWHARLFAALTFLWMTSLDSRLPLAESGGYLAVNLVTLYACFLPIERRFSVDALLLSLRERRERTAQDLDDRSLPAGAAEPYASLAVLLVVLNLAIVYVFNVVNKSGDLWRKGEAVHYVLWINRMVAGPGVLLRRLLPVWSTRGLSWLVVCVEALIAPWILWPSERLLLRTLALAAIWGLHLALGITFRLGPFSWFLMGWSLVLLVPEQWEALAALHRRRSRPRLVVYDRASPLAFALCRLIARVSPADRLRFAESDGGSPPPLLEARDEEGGARIEGPAALREIAQAIPLGRYVLTITRPLIGPLFALASAHREGVARFFGLSFPSDAPPPPLPSPLALAVAHHRAQAREALLAGLAIVLGWEVVLANPSVPERIRRRLAMPPGLAAIIEYPRVFQGWSMFAPNPLTEDGTLVVDGRTLDGRRLDPLTGREPDFDLAAAEGLGLGQIVQDYENRIRLDRHAVYRRGLAEYLRAFHRRTGQPEDELVAFDVYWVKDHLPPPDRDRPSGNERTAFLAWRKPGYRPPPGRPPIPPEPPLGSADPPEADKQRTFFGAKLPDFMQER